HEQALALREKLVADFPAIPEFRQDLAKSYNNLGSVLIDLGRIPDAQRQYEQALALRERLVAEFPTIVASRIGLGGCQTNLGNLCRQGKQGAAALAWYTRAIGTLEGVLRQTPNVTAKEFLWVAHAGRALVLDSQQRPAEAVADWDKAM